MRLQEIINAYDAGTLYNQPDLLLEIARNEVEAAINQAKFQPDLKPLRSRLIHIDANISQNLAVRYGCND